MKTQLTAMVLAGLAMVLVGGDRMPGTATAQTANTPADASTWTGDPLEPIPGFDDVTAAGTGLVGSTPIHVEYMPGGCIDASGSAPYGLFGVSVAGPTVVVAPLTCAGYGDTVTVGGVIVAFGTTGADTIDAARIPPDAHALIFGFEGSDVIAPVDGAYDNYILAGPGNDVVLTPDQDGLHGALVFGGDGDDILAGTMGRDFLIGGPGNDTLTAGHGQDEIHGSKGHDILDACPSDLSYDALIGGSDADTYRSAFLAGYRLDFLFDYEHGEVVFDCAGNQMAP